jgi:hypothetical protein
MPIKQQQLMSWGTYQVLLTWTLLEHLHGLVVNTTAVMDDVLHSFQITA